MKGRLSKRLFAAVAATFMAVAMVPVSAETTVETTTATEAIVETTEQTREVTEAMEETKTNEEEREINSLGASIESDFIISDYGEITEYLGKEKNIVIPETIRGIKVKGIEISNTSITNISNIPDGVTYINLSGCSLLTQFNVPDSVRTIMLEGCSSLKSLYVPQGIDLVNENFTCRLYGCTSLESVTISGGCTEITATLFEDCNSLKSITFKGDAPSVVDVLPEFGGSETDKFLNIPNATVYYYPTATGFTTPEWKGLPCYPITGDGGSSETNTDVTPRGNELRFTELSDREKTQAQEKVQAVLNIKKLRENQSMFHYDITLVDKGTGEIYTKENFPKEGVKVTIAYPEGMNKNSHNYRLFHFADGLEGTAVEIKPITMTDNGIQFHVYSLSPFTLVTEVKADSGSTSPKTGDDDNSITWLGLGLVSGIGGIVAARKRAGEN